MLLLVDSQENAIPRIPILILIGGGTKSSVFVWSCDPCTASIGWNAGGLSNYRGRGAESGLSVSIVSAAHKVVPVSVAHSTVHW